MVQFVLSSVLAVMTAVFTVAKKLPNHGLSTKLKMGSQWRVLAPVQGEQVPLARLHYGGHLLQYQGLQLGPYADLVDTNHKNLGRRWQEKDRLVQTTHQHFAHSLGPMSMINDSKSPSAPPKKRNIPHHDFALVLPCSIRTPCHQHTDARFQKRKMIVATKVWSLASM
jgi:hypothetical protein